MDALKRVPQEADAPDPKEQGGALQTPNGLEERVPQPRDRGDHLRGEFPGLKAVIEVRLRVAVLF